MSSNEQLHMELDLVCEYVKKYESHKNIAITNINQEFCYATDGYAKIFGTSAEDLLNIKYLKNLDNQYIKDLAKFARGIIDNLITRNDKSHVKLVSIFRNINNNDAPECYCAQITKLSNVGFKHEINNYSLDYINDIIYIIAVLKYPSLRKKIGLKVNIKAPEASLELEAKDYEILFLLSFGQSYKAIALILSHASNKNVSAASIQSYIYQRLFNKLSCCTVEDLVLKYISFYPLSNIPLGLLQYVHGNIATIFS